MENQKNSQPKNQIQGLVSGIMGDLFSSAKNYITESVDEYTQKKARMISRKVAFGIFMFTGVVFMLVGAVHLVNEYFGKNASEAWGYLIVGGLTIFIAWITVGHDEF